MCIGTAVWEAQSARLQLGRQPNGVCQRLPLKLFELLARSDAQRDRQPGHGIDVRSALFAREDGAVKLARQVFAMSDKHGAPRSVERLVGGEADDIGDADRIGVDASGDQAGHMGDIGEQIGADLVSDTAVGVPVGRVWVAAESTNDEPRLVFARQVADLVIIEALGFAVDGIADDVVIDAAAVDRAAMREVPAHNQIHAHDSIADIKQGAVDGVIGGSAR